jgi:hypothetical protein
MRLDDHTSVFTVDKRFYRIGDLAIPPTTYRAVAWGGGTVLVLGIFYWTVLSKIVGLFPLNGLIASFIFPIIFVLVPAYFAGWSATNTLRHDKRLGELLISRTQFMFQPKRLAALRDWNEPELFNVSVEIVLETD